MYIYIHVHVQQVQERFKKQILKTHLILSSMIEIMIIVNLWSLKSGQAHTNTHTHTHALLDEYTHKLVHTYREPQPPIFLDNRVNQ